MLKRQLVAPEQIIVSDPRPERCQELTDRYGHPDHRQQSQRSNQRRHLSIGGQPQVLDVVLPEVRGGARTCSLVLSIVAGASIKSISDGLANPSVVRVMPNTPAQIGQGISVWTATSEVPEEQRYQTRALLQALGEEIFVTDEDYLDMATP
jgi:pyrroline-5-carboxylate reductase